MKFTKKSIYVGLFGILYLIVAFSSFFHAVSFFGLANNSWMSVILAFAFEVGQAAVLFSLLTSKKDRNRVMPWVLMTMFTLVQVIGNVYSSYKYIITNSVENLRFFKEPIFIWTDLPDEQANVIIVYLVGALLPIAALLLTSMITNYLSDQEDTVKQIEEVDGPPEGEGRSDEQEIKDLNTLVDTKEQEIEKLKQELENAQKSQNTIDKDAEENPGTSETIETREPNAGDIVSDGTSGETQEIVYNPDEIDKEKINNIIGEEKIYDSVDEALAHEHDGEGLDELKNVKSYKELLEEKEKKPSHFINL